MKTKFDSIPAVLADIRQGKMVIVVDDADRENEGDLILAAEKATPQKISFMVRYTSGVICVPMAGDDLDRLGLPLMIEQNQERMRTAYTISVDAANGISTGISAADRAHTIAVAINPEATRDDIATPGHVFPLMAREGGTLVRAGHTEASVDISRLAGLIPAAVICEIIRDDGEMARLPDLVGFAQHHGLKLGTIADLIAYRRRTERLVKRVREETLQHAIGGDWRVVVFANTVDYAEHLVLVKGDLSEPGPALVRMHAVDLIDDIVSGATTRRLHASMRMIAAEGRGAVVMLRDTQPTGLSQRVARLAESDAHPRQLRDYGIGAQILLDLGVTEMILLSNTTRTIVGIEGYGLHVAGQRAIEE